MIHLEMVWKYVYGRQSTVMLPGHLLVISAQETAAELTRIWVPFISILNTIAVRWVILGVSSVTNILDASLT